jgi:thiol-disulfide isomerase/thioredoxin
LDAGILLADIAALCVWMFVRAVGPAPPERLRRSSWTCMCLIGVGLAICPSSPANVLPLDLGAYRGKVIYLDVWASWCAPCRESFPWMSRLQAELAPAGFVVIAVNVDRVHADAERFLQGRSPGFRVVYDPQGVIPEQFGVKGMPTSFIIDRDGTVRLRHEGFRRADEAWLAAQVRSLVLNH